MIKERIEEITQPLKPSFDTVLLQKKRDQVFETTYFVVSFNETTGAINYLFEKATQKLWYLH